MSWNHGHGNGHSTKLAVPEAYHSTRSEWAKEATVFFQAVTPSVATSKAKSLWPNQFCQNKRSTWRTRSGVASPWSIYRAVHSPAIWFNALRPHSLLKLSWRDRCGCKAKYSSRSANARNTSCAKRTLQYNHAPTILPLARVFRHGSSEPHLC